MHTVEVYKQDRRKKTGERLVLKQDYDIADRTMLEASVKEIWPAAQGYRYEIHETYRWVQNLMSGKPTRERYDTPWSCSVASESYWSS